MPKSFMYTVRDYRTGIYHGHEEYNPHVMLTRSGLSIKKVPVKSNGSLAKPVTYQAPEDRPRTRKERSRKPKSMDYMSMITRFFLYIRVPGLNISGMNARHGLEHLDDMSIGSHDDETNPEDDEDDVESLSSEDGDDSGDEYDDFIVRIAEDINNNESTDRNGNAKIHSTRDLNPDLKTKRSSTDQLDIPVIDKRDKPESERSEAYPERDVWSSGLDSNDAFSLSDSTDNSSEDQKHQQQQCLGDLRIHLMASDDDQNLVTCPECNKTFSRVSTFTAHLKTHFKSKNMCYLCGKIFSRSWLLKGHIRTHTGEKPFPCLYSGCTKAFADKSNLRSHLMIHSTTRKDYNCPHCGRAFAQKRYLHKHVHEVCRQSPV